MVRLALSVASGLAHLHMEIVGTQGRCFHLSSRCSKELQRHLQSHLWVMWYSKAFCKLLYYKKQSQHKRTRHSIDRERERHLPTSTVCACFHACKWIWELLC